MSVRVRFAPSPTGYLHVGGARTAIFNWLYARRTGGTFVLRIEDTDEQRSSEELTASILEAMDWLGMRADEGPFRQSEARERHVRDAQRLLDTGAAYRCFCTPESLREARAAAEAGGGAYRYPGTCRDLPAWESADRAAEGASFAVRFRVGASAIAWDDLVHGATSFEGSLIEDFVILRSDGSPTYMLSVVSDDIAMGMTHVIRGDDHISNTPKQIALYRALGEPVPAFAHIPLILGTDKKRLSKRHGAVSVLQYRDEGYLPEAMFNFLALLGWSPGNDRQKMSRDELIAAFDFGGIGRSGAVFDLTKLEWLNGQYLVERGVDELRPLIAARLRAAGTWDESFDGERRAWFDALVRLILPRARTLSDLPDLAAPYLTPDEALGYDEQAANRHLRGTETAEQLAAVHASLEELDEWRAETLESAIRRLAERLGLAAGKLIHPIRLAVTGRGASPGLFEVLELLGRDRSLARIARLRSQIDGR